MKTLDVKFNGTAYKIRNNQLTRRFWAEEVHANPEMQGTESVIRYSYCLLKGFNLSFNMKYLEFEMYIDDEQNIDFIKSCTELVNDLMDEMKALSQDNGEVDSEKK